MNRRTLLPFAPYFVVGIFHLVVLFVHADRAVDISKWFIMPALLVAVLITRPRPLPFVIVAVVLSWFGDVLLGFPGDLGFLIGLGMFFLAHLTYLILFMRRFRVRRIPWQVAFLGVWFVALLIVLGPHLGMLFVPVAVYGLVLGLAASAALACNRWIATGAVLFLLSDTMLAFKLFYPGFSVWQQDFFIMILYIGGQGLIIYGIIHAKVLAGRAPVQAAVPV